LFQSKPKRTGLASQIIAVAIALPALAYAATPSLAQEYPAPGRQIELIVGSSAGGGADTSARLVAEALESHLPGANIQVINKPGGATQIALQAVADAKPDGYTMVLFALPTAFSLYLDPSRQAKFTRDSFVPVGNFSFDPGAIAVRAESDYKTVQDVVEAAKAKPGEITAGITVPGAREHLDFLSFQKATGQKFNPVSFPGSTEAVNTLLGGNVDMVFGSVGDFLSQVQGGRLRIIAVFDKQPSKFVPDAPTLESAGYPYVSGVTRGVALPKGTPQEIVNKVSEALGKAMTGEMISRHEAMGLEARYMDAAEFSKYWDSELARVQELRKEITN
jgi:tripartite-type tricarboxylate transporter receptor subunit TctC